MNAILHWNAAALEANRRDFSFVPGTTTAMPEQGGPTLSSRALAIFHLAMYDAFAGVKNRPNAMPPYLTGLPAPPASANADAAIAGAAHEALSALFPRQKPHFDQDLRDARLTVDATDPSVEYGRKVAREMLRDRAFDPDAGAAGYVPSNAPGKHRADPENPDQGFHAPVYGARSKCFAVSARHVLDAPPALSSAEYKAALAQVYGKGIAPGLQGTLPAGIEPRNATETAIGLYWAYDGVNGLGTPPRLYNLIVREVIKQRGLGPEDAARLLALVNAAMGDAGILAWDEKYKYEVWRPVLGIREHDGSLGPAAPTPGDEFAPCTDTQWLPLGAPSSNSTKKNFTPPFPAYPSGHATFGAAALHMLRLFLGTMPGDRSPDTWFQGFFVSEELNGATKDNQGTVRPRHARKFDDGLWQMILENGASRIFLGVHWSFDAYALDGSGKPDLSKNLGGVPLGLKIAEDIFATGNKLAPKKSTVGPRT